MSERKDQQQVNSLRAKVKKTLKRFVNNKDVSDKEMQIFEKVVSRRQFLGGTFKLSTVAALVGQGIVPSAFAAKRPDLTLPIQEMPILTNELKETITTAAGIKVTSDVIDDILKHKHIESIEAKEYEDTLEALNTVVRAQEGFQNPNQGLEEISKNLQRTYGHPELVRLQNSQFSKDSPYMHNGHELVLYEYNTKQTAPVKKRVIQLPTAFPETLTIKLSNKTGNFELRKGDEIQNKYFRLVYLPDTGNIEIWSKDSDRYCWTLFSGEKHPEAAVLAFQTDGRLAIYSSKGNFIKDLSGMGAETKENVMLEFTSDANLKLYAGKEGCYYDANQAFDVNKNVFEDYMPQDFDYNRIVSINGHKHNTLDNGYVRNQKMILVAKQSVQGSWDGSPGKWLEHTSEMSSCWEQMRLYVQNSRHAVHCPDGMQLKAVYDQGSISDTSGDRWHVYNPLAILQENMIKLLDHQIDPRIPRSGSGYRGFKAKNLRLTIEDIGKFESGNNFACLYGTVKVNLWMNLGFYIFFKEGQEAPVVKFVSLNNKHRYEYLWWSDNNDSDMFWRMAGNKNYRITDSDLNDKNPRVGHALLRRGDTKSFIEQLFRPIGYFNKGQKLLMAYENTHSGDGGEHFARSIAMHFIPTTIDNELYIYDIQDESFLKESHKKFGDKYTEYVCPKERETGIIFNSTVDTYLKHSLFNQNSGLARPIFQFEKYYSTYSNEYYKLYFSGGSYVESRFDSLCEATVQLDESTSSHNILRGDPDKCIHHEFGYIYSSFYLEGKSDQEYASKWFSKAKIKKAYFSRSLIGAARYIVHTEDGGLYIFRQQVDKDGGGYGRAVTQYNNSIQWESTYLPLSTPSEKGSNNRYCKTLRLLDWSKYASDHELIVVQENNLNNTKAKDISVKKQYKYLTKEIADETWHDHVINAQVAAGEEHITEHCEKTTIYNVKLQAENIYNKDCVLRDDQAFEIRFAQPCYFEIFTGSDQRNEGAYAKRLESYFVKPDASGKVSIQVKAPEVDRLSGITFYYRIIDGYKFQSAVSMPLLRLKNEVEDIYAWHDMNLAYNVHARMDEQSRNNNGNLLKEVMGNLDADYKGDSKIESDLKTGLQQASSKLRQASFGEEDKVQFKSHHDTQQLKTGVKRRVSLQPNILYRHEANIALYQNGVNSTSLVNPLFNPSQIITPGQLGGWLSDIWHKVCDFAIAILNKIKEAINWIKNKLNDLLKAIADLEIPIISDIAKIAKSVVSLVAGVLTAIVDVAIMIVNILKYIFDFDIALDTGKAFYTYVGNLSNLTKLRVDNVTNLYADNQDLPDINAMMEKVNPNELVEFEQKKNQLIQDGQDQSKGKNDKPDNFDHISDLLEKHDANRHVEDAINLQFQQHIRNSLQSNTTTGLRALQSNSEINKLSTIFKKQAFSDTGCNLTLISNELKQIDNNSLLDTLMTSIKELIVDFSIFDVLSSLEKVKLPSFLTTILDWILGIKLNNMKDVLCLFVGYPLMLASALISYFIAPKEENKLILNKLNNVNKLLEPKKVLTGGLTYTDNKWHKDEMVYIAEAINIYEKLIAGLDVLQPGFKYWKYVKYSVKAATIGNKVVTTGSKSGFEILEKFGVSMPLDNEFYIHLYNDFSQKKQETLKIFTQIGYVTSTIKGLLTGYQTHLEQAKDDNKDKKYTEAQIKEFEKMANTIGLICNSLNLVMNICKCIVIENKNKQVKQLNMHLAKDIIDNVADILLNIIKISETRDPYMLGSYVAVNAGSIGLSFGIMLTDEDS